MRCAASAATRACERRAGVVEHAAVDAELVVGAGVDHAGESVLAERIADRVDELDGELAVPVGERAPALVGE